MAKLSTAILAIASGLAIGYAMHYDSSDGQETSRVIAQGAVSQEADASYSDQARMNLTALITRADPAMDRQRGMSQQQAECAYYAKNDTPWLTQAANYYERRDKCTRYY